jgi:hypothetical protein
MPPAVGASERKCHGSSDGARYRGRHNGRSRTRMSKGDPDAEDNHAQAGDESRVYDAVGDATGDAFDRRHRIRTGGVEPGRLLDACFGVALQPGVRGSGRHGGSGGGRSGGGRRGSGAIRLDD